MSKVNNTTFNKQEIHELFDYRDGQIYWKKPYKKNARHKAGDLAGFINNGYWGVRMNGKFYAAHRIVWLLHNDFLPRDVDHIDGNPLNNKIENLRAATRQQNAYNSKKPSNNTSGYKNVIWHKNSKKWQVLMRVDGKMRWFGTYFDKEVANFVAETMRYKYHKNFANNG